MAHPKVYPMRTNIVLDEELVHEAMRYANVKTKRELVDLALREFVAARRRRDVSELFGKVQIDPDYDYKTLRREGA
jgi:Arc/MetJ family transcription regulator